MSFIENPPDENEEILLEIIEPLAIITLNRPEALNALTLNMLNSITGILDKLEEDQRIKAVLFVGKGEKAFCAGGDIKQVAKHGVNDPAGTAKYFYQEYRLNRKIKDYTKPLISYMDGIVMGGGFGIAGPSRFKIASERTLFAMPEVGIGLFPDVGSMYFLTKIENNVGCYLSITGRPIKVTDVIKYNIASYYVPSFEFTGFLDGFITFLGSVKEHNDLNMRIAEYLNKNSKTVPEDSELLDKEAVINKIFHGDTIEEIIKKLKGEEDIWSQETANFIGTRCPTSLKITLNHYNRSEGRSFHEVTGDDFMIVQHILKGTEFYEGVRALLIDKDKSPVWKPSTLEEIGESEVNQYFTPTEWNLDDIINDNN
jgi:enoyl-CoA hydratase